RRLGDRRAGTPALGRRGPCRRDRRGPRGASGLVRAASRRGAGRPGPARTRIQRPGPAVSGLPALVVTADQRHGVTVAARDLAAAVATTTGVRLDMPAVTLLGEHPPERAHLHFTDRLWAGSPEQAAALVERVAARTALTVTLHDVPQASDGP